jgi:hypothetical protein
MTSAALSETNTRRMPLWMLSVRKSADSATEGNANVETRWRSIAESPDVQNTSSAPSTIGCDTIRAERLNGGQSAGRATSPPFDEPAGAPVRTVAECGEAGAGGVGAMAGASLQPKASTTSGDRNTARPMGAA